MRGKYKVKPPPPDFINNSDLSGMKTFKKGFLILVVLFGAFFLTFKTVPQFFVLITPQRVENKMAKLFSKHPMIRDAKNSEKLNKTLAKLLKQAPKSLAGVKANKIVFSQENAFATVGKNIYVSDKLIKQSGSEVELAFVMAHELGHVYYKHPLKILYGQITLQALTAFVDNRDFGLNLVNKYFISSFSRGQEVASDKFALDLVYQTYGHVEGALNFFERIKKYDKFIKIQGSFLSTHPLSQERIDTLTQYAKDKNFKIDSK